MADSISLPCVALCPPPSGVILLTHQEPQRGSPGELEVRFGAGEVLLEEVLVAGDVLPEAPHPRQEARPLLLRRRRARPQGGEQLLDEGGPPPSTLCSRRRRSREGPAAAMSLAMAARSSSAKPG
jgi:hypothetical protein